jgi:phage terminase large subunit-like protein
MVVASFFGEKDDRKIYIHPNPINKRMTFYEMEKTIEFLCESIDDSKGGIPIIEDVGSQKWLYDQLKRQDILAELSKTQGLSKDVRLKKAGIQLEAGRVFFPEKGTEELLDQILNFGTEKYDDLADAFSIVVSGGVEKERKTPGFLKFLEEKAKNVEKNPPNTPGPEDHLREWLRCQGYFGPLDGIK